MTHPNDLENRVRSLIVEELELDVDPQTIAVDQPLQDPPLSLDSMAYARFLVALEDEFDIRIEDDEAGTVLFQTLGEIVAFVRQRQDAG